MEKRFLTPFLTFSFPFAESAVPLSQPERAWRRCCALKSCLVFQAHRHREGAFVEFGTRRTSEGYLFAQFPCPALQVAQGGFAAFQQLFGGFSSFQRADR